VRLNAFARAEGAVFRDDRRKRSARLAEQDLLAEEVERMAKPIAEIAGARRADRRM
jgi:hypothetical protein